MASLAVSKAGTVGPPQGERCMFARFSGGRGNGAFNPVYAALYGPLQSKGARALEH